MKKKIINGILAASILIAAPSAFVSCKDNDADVSTELNSRYNDLQKQLDALKADVAKINSCTCSEKWNSLYALLEKYNNLDDFVKRSELPGIIEGYLANYYTQSQIDAMLTGYAKTGDLGNYFTKDEINSMLEDYLKRDGVDLTKYFTKEEIITIFGDYYKDGKLVVDLSNYYTIEDIKNIFGDYYQDGKLVINLDEYNQEVINQVINMFGDYIVDGHFDLSKYYTKEEILNMLGDYIVDGKLVIDVDVDLSNYYTKDDITNMFGDYIVDGKLVIDLSNYIDSEALDVILQDYLKSGDIDLTNYITNDKIAEILGDYYKEGKFTIDWSNYYTKEEVDALIPEVISREEIGNMIESQITTFGNSLAESINNMITSITLQGTYNPIIGQLAFPGFRPNIIASYYGDLKKDLYFPEDDLLVYSQDEQIAEDKDTRYISTGGKIFLTLNPNEVPTEGKNIVLMNSQGKVSPFALSSLKPSTDPIIFGWKMRSPVYVYEAEATLNPNFKPSDVGVTVQSDILKNDVKRIQEERSIKSLANIVGDLFTNAVGDLPAQGINITWSDPVIGTKNVTSAFDIAAVAVKPLGFDFDYDLSDKRIPGFNRLERWLDGIVDQIKVEYNLDIPNKGLKIESVDFGWEGTSPIATVVVTMNGKTKTYTVRKSKLSKKNQETWDKLIESANNPENLNDLNRLLVQLQNMDETINEAIDKTKENIKDLIHDYIDHYYRKVKDIVGVNLNRFIEPTLLVKNSEGLYRPSVHSSGNKGNKGEVSLILTSYTGELLAPAKYKFVAITSIDGVPVSAEDQPEGFGKILPGTQQTINFKLEPGKTYTVVYQAVDYFGTLSEADEYTIVAEK